MAKKLAVRVDDRLIHGQVVTKWVSFFNIETIIVIDSDIAKDKTRKNILKFAAPPSVKLRILSVDKAVENWNKDEFGNKNVFVLFAIIKYIKECWDKGLQFKDISLGQMAVINERKQIHLQMGMDASEAKVLLDLEKEGAKIYFQMLPTDGQTSLDVVRKAFPELS